MRNPLPHQSCSGVVALLASVWLGCAVEARAANHPLTPRLVGEWWTIAGDPDLGPLAAPKQQPVDFGIWQAADGTWQLWSCIRGTKEPGNTRLFHRWEGAKLTDTHWTPKGIALQADPALGETRGGLQAPFVLRHDGKYWMFYGDWANICLATSADGKTFARHRNAEGKPQLNFAGKVDRDRNGRDPMVLRIDGQWHCYYTAHPGNKGCDYARTSDDLLNWGEERVVAAGGRSGDGPYSAECPFVVEPLPGHFYLFRTQVYGKNAQTMVYHSRDPLDFGIGNDTEHYVTTLPVAAPEIFQHAGQWYLAALLPSLKGIQLTRLEWEKVSKGLRETAAAGPSASNAGQYRFDKTISRAVLENYLARAITMEGLLNGRGDPEDNIRMLKRIGAKFIGRALCLWGGEGNLLRNLERAQQQIPKVLEADADMILQACIFEIVTTQVEQVPVPDWAFAAFGLPAENRNFRYSDMLYPSGRLKDHWRPGQSVPDVSRPETKLWFYFLGASFIKAGCEAIHLGQTELMNGNDRGLEHYSQVLALIRAYATQHARRHLVLCDSHVPSGGLVREGRLLMDFHSFPLRIMEVPDKPQEAILKVGFSDGIYGRSKGGLTPSGWPCELLPYLVEIDNWGVSKQPGQPRAGSIWIWGYDEITWFAHQSQEYRSNWLRYAWDWVRRTDTNGYLQMPGSRTLVSPLDRKRWYYANNPSPSVPEGFSDEEAIRAIWAADSEKR